MKKPIFVISMLILICVLGGCWLPGPLVPKGNLKVVVNIPTQLQNLMANASLATEGFDVTTMKIRLTKGNDVQEQTINLTENQSTVDATFANLGIGQWSVDVQVLDGENHLIYTGTGTGTVAASTTSTITIALEPNPGGLIVQVTFPEGAGVASGDVKLTHALNNTNAPNEVTQNLSFTDTLGTTEFTGLYPTSWQMYVTLQDAAGALLAEGEDSIEILPGRTITVAVELTIQGDVLISVVWDLPPAKPVGLAGISTETGVQLTWTPNTEPNLAGYRVYRSNAVTGSKHLLNIDLVTATEYLDTTASEGTNWYWVRAVTTPGLASVLSDPVNVDVQGGAEYGELEGYVCYFDQVNHAGIQVSIAGLTTLTNSEGYFYFQSVPAGESVLSAEAESYYTNSLVVGIMPNTLNQIDTLYMYPVEVYGSVSGYAKYLNGTNHTGIAVEIRTLDGQQLPGLIAMTDATGYFYFPEVPVDPVSNTATYIFTAFKLNDPSGYSSDSQEILVTGNTHTTIERDFILRYAAVEVIIFADDPTPWNSNALESMLSSLNVTYNIYTSSDIPNISLPLDKIVWIVNDQPQGFYDVYAQYQSKFDQFVYNGGTMLFEACDEGWNGGSLLETGATMPGGVKNNLNYCSTNTVVNPTHPMMTGIPIDLSGTYASHNWFSDIPAGYTILTVDEDNNPTLIEYRYNLGRVIATGQPLEFHCYYNQNPKGIYPNMIYYTFDWEIPTPVVVANMEGVGAPVMNSGN